MNHIDDIVSIIVVVYNTQQYLEQCLHSICNQTYPYLEIILLNNGSTDGSAKIMENYAQKDSRIQVHSLGRQTVSYARNRGIALASGKHITFVDSDDFVTPDFIEKLLYYKKKYCTPISVCCLVRYIDEDNIIDKIPLNKVTVISGATACQWMNRFLNLCTPMTVVWNKLFDAELLKNIDFPEEPWGEDMFVTYKILYPMEKIVVIPDRLYYWRENPLSLSRRTKNIPKQICEIKAYEERIRFFQEKKEDILCALTKRRCFYVMAQQLYKQKRYVENSIRTQGLLKHKIRNLYPKLISRKEWSIRTRCIMTFAFLFPYWFGYLSVQFQFDLEK
jgi:glycosyltransferase involved in cell wall biosynthesis